MKNKKSISALLAILIVISVFYACANRIENAPSKASLPSPAASNPKESAEQASLADISKLNEKDLKKISDNLYNKLLSSPGSTEIEALITLQPALDDIEFDQAVENKRDYNRSMLKQIEEEISALKSSKNTSGISEAKKTDIDSEIKKLEEKIPEHSITQRNCVNQVVAEVHTPYIDNFATKYSLTDYSTIGVASTISKVTVSLDMVASMAADPTVEYIEEIDQSDVFHDYGYEDYFL